MKCNKCHIEKDNSNYYSYYHSVRNKLYTRRICNDCINTQGMLRRRKIVQPVVLKSIPEVIEDYSTNPNYKKCQRCREYYPHNEYQAVKETTKFVYRECKKCIKEKDEIRRQKELQETGGGNEYFMEPGRWQNDVQKEQVHSALLCFGWKFNEEKNIWYKEGIKDEDGNFLNIKPYKRPNVAKLKTPETIAEMRKMKINGSTFQEIATIYQLGHTTVTRWIRGTNI